MAAKSLLELHQDKECSCSDNTEGNDCISQLFPDGWDFTPDRGKGKDTGEIFTPVPVINRILADLAMVPGATIYKHKYSSKGAPKYIAARVCDQACGTGNFFIIVLNHKLGYCRELFEKEQSLKKLEVNILRSISSMYAYDIDPGNLELLKRRSLSHGKHPVDDYKAINYWTEYQDAIFNGQDYQQNKKNVPLEEIRLFTSRALSSAQEYWGDNLKDGRGLIDEFYRQLIGDRMPDWLYWQIREILDKNIKLFDGLSMFNILREGDFRPGIESVEWTEWSIVEDPENPDDPPFIREVTSKMADDLKQAPSA
jgi:hypothetical protein